MPTVEENKILKMIEAKADELESKHLISKLKFGKETHNIVVNFSKSAKKYCRETVQTGFAEMPEEKWLEIQKLKFYIAEILEFPDEWVDNITVTGISFSYDPENEMALRGMVVTMQRDYEHLNCPLNLNTPFIKFQGYEDAYSQFPTEEATWNYDVFDLIRTIVHNAFMYLCGDYKELQQNFEFDL